MGRDGLALKILLDNLDPHWRHRQIISLREGVLKIIRNQNVHNPSSENFEGNRLKNEHNDVFLNFLCIKMHFWVIKVAYFFLVQILIQK